MESDDELVEVIDPHVPDVGGVQDLRVLPEPVDGEMTSGQFTSLCASLGLSRADVARMLDVSDRTARAWFSGRDPIPPWLATLVRDWRKETSDLAVVLAGMIETVNDGIDQHEDPDAVLEVYRTNHEFWSAYPEMRPWPARWWMMVCVRASEYSDLPRFSNDMED